MDSRGQFHFKLVLLGNAGVGKSSITLRFVREEFSDDQETTIGAAFLTKNVALDDCNVKIEIWDTAGQERYRSLAPMYYRGAQAAIIVFSITDRDSFEGAKTWVKELQRRGDPNMVIALAGNKADLVAKRKVTSEEANEYAASLGAGVTYIETSAKDAVNVEQLFHDVAKRVPKTRPEPKKDVVALDKQQAAANSGTAKKAGCC